MKRLRLGIVGMVAGASLLLAGTVSHASTPPVIDPTAGLAFGPTGTMTPLAQVRALQQDTGTLQARLATVLRGQDSAVKYTWEQVATAEVCVAGGTACLGPNASFHGDAMFASLTQEGFTDTNGGAPLVAIVLCARFHMTSPGNGTLTEAVNETGPVLASEVSGAGSSGSVQLINAAPTSTAAIAVDSGDLSTGVSVLRPPSNGAANASTRITGGDVADNPAQLLRGGQLKVTLTGDVVSEPVTNGKAGAPTAAPGSLSCGIAASAAESSASNELVPLP
jgi:hypothetical protein